MHLCWFRHINNCIDLSLLFVSRIERHVQLRLEHDFCDFGITLLKNKDSAYAFYHFDRVDTILVRLSDRD